MSPTARSQPYLAGACCGQRCSLTSTIGPGSKPQGRQKKRRRSAKSICSTDWSIRFIVPITNRSSGSASSTGFLAGVEPRQHDRAVPVLQQAERLAEQPAEVGAIDLVEDEHTGSRPSSGYRVHALDQPQQEAVRVDGVRSPTRRSPRTNSS